MLYAASKPLGVWFRSEVVDPDSGSPLDRKFLSILICLTVLILVRRKFSWSRALRENPWLVALIMYMLISILWSSMPYVSFKRWVREALAILVAFTICSEHSPHQAIESVLRRMTYILLPFSLLLIKYFPDYGVLYTTWEGYRMWIGTTLHKNSLGQLCLISVFFLICSLIRKWRGRYSPVWKYEIYAELSMLALALWLIRGPQGRGNSATSISVLVIGLLIYWGLRLLKKAGKIPKKNTLSVIVAIIIIVGIATVFTGGSMVGSMAFIAGRDATLTGRTRIWGKLLPFAKQKPVLGGGFGGFWTASRHIEIAPHAHSGYLEVILGLGFFGMLLTSLFLVSSMRKAQEELSHDFDWATLWICFLIMTLVHSMTEASIQNFAAPLTAVVLFFTVSSSHVISHK